MRQEETSATTVVVFCEEVEDDNTMDEVSIMDFSATCSELATGADNAEPGDEVVAAEPTFDETEVEQGGVEEELSGGEVDKEPELGTADRADTGATD